MSTCRSYLSGSSPLSSRHLPKLWLGTGSRLVERSVSGSSDNEGGVLLGGNNKGLAH
jgi:hypothetical protein